MQDGVDRYLQLQCTASGRVGGYDMTYIPGISLAQMRTAIAAELPADARITSDTAVEARCELVRYASPTLSRVLGADDPHGDVIAEITLTNNPENVNQLSLTIPAPAATGTPGPTAC